MDLKKPLGNCFYSKLSKHQIKNCKMKKKCNETQKILFEMRQKYPMLKTREGYLWPLCQHPI